ncbi:MAG: ribosomal protein S18-alanine N-acetyltransferase [Thermodesulfobacteriota bacterium]|nr:ribosomal protein S18-alanine N-acetyltransferase [Thermodesulfobacteriota bacterium]
MDFTSQNIDSSIPWMTGLQISNMEEKDIDEVLEIENVSFTSPWTRTSFEHELDLKHSKILIAKKPKGDQKPIVGYISFWLVLDEVHILNLAIHPDFRRQGIASHLIRFCIQSSRINGANNASLEVRRSNIPAISLYKKFGFQVKGIRPGYYSDNHEDAVIMWSKISQNQEYLYHQT